MRIKLCTIKDPNAAPILTELELMDGAVVADALVAANLNLESACAIFARKVTAATKLHEGDRLDVGSSLLIDPKRARELRAQNRHAQPIPKPRHGGKHQRIKPAEI